MNDSSADDDIPSYVIVQEQMRDLILIQDETIGNIARTNVETLSASRDIFCSSLKEKEDKIGMLENSIAKDYVSRERYDNLVETTKREYVPRENFENLQAELQAECESHAETQTALEDVVHQLDQLQERLKTMEVERENDMTSFNVAYNELGKELAEARENNRMLQSKLQEMHHVNEQRQQEISSHEQTIAELQTQRQVQSQKYRHQLQETEVEKQQEAYLQRMMADGQRKHKKPSK